MEVLKSLYNSWCKIPDKIRFLLIGGVNAGVSYVIFAFALWCLGEAHYQTCVILQWTLSSVFSYFNQKFFVFCTKGNYLNEYLKCCSTWAVSYVVNVIILELLVKFAIKNVYIAQFVSIFLVSVITYVLFKYFAFKKK
ncbi:MAG: GtrA family protein [Candidatus Gastranaerophilaceae bacterium]